MTASDENERLLDLIQANGKTLRDCNGWYCQRAARWLITVGEKVGDNVAVGTRLSEKDVACIYARTSFDEIVPAATIVLLELIQTNGKTLRDCSGWDCQQVARGLIAVSKRVGHPTIVGTMLSEAEVEQIFARHVTIGDAFQQPTDELCAAAIEINGRTYVSKRFVPNNGRTVYQAALFRTI